MPSKSRLTPAAAPRVAHRSLLGAAAVAAALLFSLRAPAAAQQSMPADPAAVAKKASMRRALERVKAEHEQAIQDEIDLCEIAAPPFHEQERGRAYAERLQALGFARVWTDSAGNVIAEKPGAADGPVVVLAGHLDTVFPPGTDVSVERERNVLKGPGIGDDCRGLTVVLSVARALQAEKIGTPGTIYFVGDVGEEGLGDLRGMKQLFGATLKDRIDYFISVDGAGYGVTKDAVGSNRYKVSYKGPGGHSYGAFGMPSPIHALGRAIAKVADFQVPASPKTTFNVGEVEGGTSVNSIAFEASMLVDMRSVSADELAKVDAKFQEAVQAALEEENQRARRPEEKLTVDVESVGVRPAGSQPADAPIVLTAVAAGKVIGFDPEVGASSTDSNVPISLGIPAVTIDGGGSGHGAHSLDETFDATDAWKGTQWALLLVTSLAGGVR